MHFVVFDTEIALPVESCPKGWEGARRGDCGLSACVIWDSITQRYHIYDKFTLNDAIRHLESADLIVGFNSDNFDLPLLESMYKGAMQIPPSYDILQAVWDEIGKKKGYKLTDICERTLGLKKSGSGEFAPTLYKQGRFAELFDYCLNDVHITRMLFEHIRKEGYIIDTEGERLYLSNDSHGNFGTTDD